MKNNKKLLNNKPRKGFTLVEILIATSLFALVVVITSNIFIDIVHQEKKDSIRTAVYNDLQIFLQQLKTEIQNGTIDYEEYYNMEVVQYREPNDETKFYGTNYGVYASRFFNPGKSLKANPPTINPDDLGVECSYPKNLDSDENCEIYFTNSNDINTGINPYNNNAELANAFCDDGIGVRCADKIAARGGLPVNYTNELYLIDYTGTKKTIAARKFMGRGEYSIGMIKMQGKDLDQNGIVDVFGCNKEFLCFQNDNVQVIADEIKYSFIQDMLDAAQPYLEQNGISLPQKSDLSDAFIPETSQFIPFLPKIINVKDLTFAINPAENPYLAFGEKEVQIHPTVTIYITVGLSEEAEKDYPGEFQDFTVQETIAAGVVGKLDAYPPVNDVLKPRFNPDGSVRARDGSWIGDVL